MVRFLKHLRARVFGLAAQRGVASVIAKVEKHAATLDKAVLTLDDEYGANQREVNRLQKRNADINNETSRALRVATRLRDLTR